MVLHLGRMLGGRRYKKVLLADCHERFPAHPNTTYMLKPMARPGTASCSHSLEVGVWPETPGA